MFPIALPVDLNCIVSQVNHLITDIIEIEVFRSSSDVALAVPIGSHEAVDSSDDHVMADVKFPAFIEQGVFNVFLDDIGLRGTVRMFLLFF